MTGEDAEKLLDQMAAQLGEHFDSVQIMVTWNEEAVTKCCRRGVGNWYARQGMAHDFINCDMAQEQARQISAQLHPPTDDGDEWKAKAAE